MNDTEKRTREAVARTQSENEVKAARDTVLRAKVARVNWEAQEKAVEQAVQDAEAHLLTVLQKHGLAPAAPAAAAAEENE